MIALLMPFMVVTSIAVVEAQELEGPILKLIDIEEASAKKSAQEESDSDDTQEDKWALTDEDRMTDEEMDEELFGNGARKSDSSEGQGGDESQSTNDVESPSSESNDDDGASNEKKKPARQAPKPTIESYLRNINSLTIDTYTPPATGLDSVDVPMKAMPPQQVTPVRQATSSTLYFQTPDIYHRPLYFEDQNFERYGIHRCRRQPLESARKFASDTASLPREIRKQSPGSCVYRANPRYNHPSLIPTNR